MYTVETILNRINGRGYRIKVSYVQKMLKETIKEGGKLKKELSKFANIDLTNNSEVIGFINKTLLRREAIKGNTVTNTALEELFTETNNPFFQTLIQYRKSSYRYTKVCSFIKNVIEPDFDKTDKDNVKAFLEKEKFGDIRIGPTAKLNVSGGISLSNPSLPFSVEDIRMLLINYNVAISCDDMEGVLYILNEYGDLICGNDYLVVGTTFYAEMEYYPEMCMPFPMPDKDDVKHMKDFRVEFLGENPDSDPDKDYRVNFLDEEPDLEPKQKNRSIRK